MPGDNCPALEIACGFPPARGGQLYWSTETSPGFFEARDLHFPITADGQFHTYRLEPGRHPQWAGQTITGLRIDPGNGAAQAEFAIDWIRAVP